MPLPPSNQPPPIIIRRKKKGGHDGHHGGAWKVAYADFVTAMMAFFLLLWLLNVTTDKQKHGIADYFNPVSVSKEQSGNGSVLGGLTITAPGSLASASSPITVTVPIPGNPGVAAQADQKVTNPDPDATAQAGMVAKNGKPEADKSYAGSSDTKPPSAAALDKALAARESKQFQETAAALRQAIQQVPELKDLQKSLLIEQTPEGLRIQLVDQDRLSMFPNGSSQMYPKTRELLQLVAKVVSKLPNKLSITGHTDSTPFSQSDVYDNWELSTDRANASRRVLEQAGVDPSRISEVIGRADTAPLVPNDPASPRNRRISIVLLRTPSVTKAAAATPAPAPAPAPAPVVR